MAEVWSLGTLGVESRDAGADRSEYLVYFGLPLGPAVRELIRGRQTVAGAEMMDAVEVSLEDWQRTYRQRSSPFAVGKNWWVDPREPDLRLTDAPDQRRSLRIPARTAFGTGSHASTALMVELMEEMRFEDKRVLDVGTGSGILAMIALAMGAESVTAVDIDPVATFVARETCRLNGFLPRLLAGGMAAIRLRDPSKAYDVALANVLPTRLRADIADVVASLRPAGVLLLSGMLRDQQSEVVAEMAGLGLRCKSRHYQEEWVALRLERLRS